MIYFNFSSYHYYSFKLLLIFLAFIFTDYIQAQDKLYDSRTGVQIIFSAEGNIFPDNWYSNEIDAKAISLDIEEYERSEMLMKQVLLKYPISVIKDNLDKIYVLNYLEFYGISFGGTSSFDAVYLSNEGVNLGYTDFYLKQLFHAEFSSILFRNYTEYFDDIQWESINPEAFEYGNGGVDKIKEGLSSENFLDSLNSMGFLNEYATSSLENDFNSFAKNLFEPTDEFQKLLLRYESLQQKADILKQFYETIDSQFSNSFWDNFILTNSNLLIDNLINIYPNPVIETIHLRNLPLNSRLYLINSSGNIIKSITVHSSHEQIYIGNLSQGLYILRMDNNKTWKIIKR